ncbi:hypothetical protein TcCL_ESM05802, partial [Trypanosoma cruzi]
RMATRLADAMETILVQKELIAELEERLQQKNHGEIKLKSEKGGRSEGKRTWMTMVMAMVAGHTAVQVSVAMPRRSARSRKHRRLLPASPRGSKVSHRVLQHEPPVRSTARIWGRENRCGARGPHTRMGKQGKDRLPKPLKSSNARQRCRNSRGRLQQGQTICKNRGMFP